MLKNRILAVEDDPALQNFYQRFSKIYNREFLFYIAPCGEEALRLLHQKKPDLLLLDWSLPDVNGSEILHHIRADSELRSLPVFVVTGLSSADDCAGILEAGADDYLSKPFDTNVLLARLHSLLRRREKKWKSEEHRIFTAGDLRLDLSSNSLTIAGKGVDLLPKEIDILTIFLRRPNILHPPGYLWEQVWDYESKHWRHTLISTLCSLRKKLGEKWKARLECHKSKGYLFRI